MESAERARLSELLVRLADGDRSAFDPLYDALQPMILRLAERMVGPPDAADVAQAVMLKVFERAAVFEADRDAVAWVLGIAAFECRTVRTKAGRRRETGLDDQAEAVAWAGLGPLDAVLARDVERAFRETFGELAPADRETLRSVASGDRPDVAPATFRKRVERAFARFRKSWKGGDR